MKLRLPLLLLSAVMSAYIPLYAYTEVPVVDGKITLADDQMLVFEDKDKDVDIILDTVANGHAGISVDSGFVFLDGTVTGTGNLDKVGGGNLVLNNIQNFYFTGDFTIKEGTVEYKGGTNDANEINLCSGNVIAESGTRISINTSTNGNYFLKNNYILKGGSIVEIKEGNHTFDGKVTIDAEGKAAEFQYESNKTVTLKGGLSGKGNLDLWANGTEWRPYGRNFVLDCSGEEFVGTINVKGEKCGLYLRLKNEKSAVNSVVNLTGGGVEGSNIWSSYLEVDTASTTIKELNGNQYSQVKAITAGNKLIITNGGDFAGTFAGGVNLEVTSGIFSVGNVRGATMDGTLTGAGSLKISDQRVLTVKSNLSYTGNTILENGGMLSLITGGSISSSNLLEINGGMMILGNGQAQHFNGAILSAGGGDSIVAVGAGASLDVGTITGEGVLIIAGTDSITGVLGEGGKLSNVVFSYDGRLYSASEDNGSLVRSGALSDLELECILYSPVAGTVTQVNEPLPGDKSKLLQTGEGTVSLNASVSDYTGQYVVCGGGTLRFTSASGEVKGTSILSNGSTLEFNVNSGELVMSGTFSGDGNILKTGSGTVVFKDFSEKYASGDVTIQAGTLRVEASEGAVIFGVSGSSGTIRVGNDAELRLYNGNGLVINKNVALSDNSRIYNVDVNNATFNGSMTVNGKASICFENDKQMTLKGNLIGDRDSVLSISSMGITAWGGARMLTLSSKNENFQGHIKVEVIKNSTTWSSTLRLENAEAAVNAVIDLVGQDTGNAILKLKEENTKIAGLTGNKASLIEFEGRENGTLTIRNGGSYEGNLANGLTLSLTQGTLALATDSDRVISNVVSGEGGMGVISGKTLTYGGAATYTGATVLNESSTLILNAGTGSLSSSSTLELHNGSKLVISGGTAQAFNGVKLVEGAGATISADNGFNLTLGTITGTGVSLAGGLIISGITSFTGSIAPESLGVIAFYDGASYYNARLGSGGDSGKILKGTEFQELAANSNDSSQGFVFKNNADLTMDNAAGTVYAIGRLAVTGAGRTLTLGAGGLKISDSLIYSNAAEQSMTITGGPLELSSLKKDGEGALVINSALTAFNISVNGTLSLGGGGTLSKLLNGTGTINFNATSEKSFTINGDVSGFVGAFNIAANNTVTLNASGPGGSAVLQGSGIFNFGGGDFSATLAVDKNIYTGAIHVKSGRLLLTGITSVDPAETSTYDPGTYLSPSSLKIEKGAVLEIDQTMLTDKSQTESKPLDARTIRNLTGEGTLVLRTVGGEAAGGVPGNLGSYVYVGAEGFTGTIEVRKGTLSFREGDFGQGKILLNGGSFGSGVSYDGDRKIDKTIGNAIEIGSGGGILRMFKDETLTLTGKLSGSGQILCADGGYLVFAGDMSDYSGRIILDRWQDADIGIKFSSDTTAMGIFEFKRGNVEFSGASTRMKGMVISAARPDNRFVFNGGKLILGSAGITTTLESYSVVFSKDVVLSAYENWETAANVSLDLSATSGLSVDTDGYNISFVGDLIFGEGADHQNLVKAGAGTLTVKKDLNLAGDISIKGGVLDYVGTNMGGRSIRFENNAVLRLSQSQDLTATVSGTGTMELLSGVSLNVKGAFRGGATLDLKGGNTITFTGSATGAMGAAALIASGANIIKFTEGVNLGMSMGDLLLEPGGSLSVLNYVSTINNFIAFDGFTAWQKLDGITINDGKATMVDTRGHLIEYQENVVIGSLVKSGVQKDANGNEYGYEYKSNSQYYGALDGAVVDFSQPFTFASGASTYGFTTQDDVTSGMRAGSFTVSSQLTDAGSTSRVVSVLGQAGASDRTITLTNTANNFTGNVTVTNAVLKVDAADPSAIGNAPVTILGKNNTVYLLENATLDLATGAGAYVYGNGFTLNGSNAQIRQTEGEHTLTGAITLNGTGNRVIDNTLSSGALTLSGNMISRGENTLVLKTMAGDDSRIILSLSGNTTVNRLQVDGNVEQTRNGISVSNGMTLGSNASYLLSSGFLAVGGELNSSNELEKVITFGNGTSLNTLGSGLVIGQNIKLAFAQEQSVLTLDSGSGTMSFKGTLGSATSDNILVKKGTGVLDMYRSITTPAAIRVEQGTLSLKEGTRLSVGGDFALLNGSTLNLEKGSNLTVSSARTFTFNGSITGSGGDISGVDKLTFNDGTRYAAHMNNQTWSAVFKKGSTFSGTLLKHGGDIVFEYGSHIVFDTSLPVSDRSIGISTVGTQTVRFNGATVSATTDTPEIDWDATQAYKFTLVKSMKELLGSDGQALTMDNLSQSVSVGGDGWGAFLKGELSLSDDSKELLVSVERNGNALSSYAQTSNQVVVGRALDEAMNNFSTLGLRGTELGDVIQYFNKMGQRIAAEAPDALGMVGGLSNYQALAGQRTDMMRHMEAVRQRANAGKGLVGISNIPDNSFWAEGTQGYTRMDGTDSSTPGYTAQSWGAAIGMDYLSAPTYSLGVAFAYSNLKVDSNQYAGQTKSDNYYVDLYGRWESGNWNGVVVLSGGTANVDVKRTMSLGEDTYNGTGSTDGTQILGMAEVAYNWQWEEEGPVLQPYLGMAVGQSKLDGYTESGLGNASLMLDEQKQTVAQASLGVRLFKQNIDREMQYEESRWELRAGLVEEFGDTDFVTRSSFIGLPGYTMQTRSEDIGKTGLQIGAGFSKALDESWSVFGDVNGEFRSGQKSINSTLGLRCTF